LIRVAQIGGGLIAGGVALKLVPTPVIVISVCVALSYCAVRILLWALRWVCAKLNDIEFRLPDLHSISASRRIAEVMKLADERILELKQELAEAQRRVAELEAERDGLDRAKRTAEAGMEHLQHELQTARDALQAAGEELRHRPSHGEDALYHRVGLVKDAPVWLVTDAHKSYRRKFHPDLHPAHRKDACHKLFVEAEHAFQRIYALRGIKT
jgi:signal transduction histidine kinase